MAQGSSLSLKSYSKKTLRKNVSKSAQKYKRNALMSPGHPIILLIELIQYRHRIGKKVYSHRIGLGHQHGRRSIVLEHQYGRRDVM